MFAPISSRSIVCLFWGLSLVLSPVLSKAEEKAIADFTVGLILPLTGRAAEYGIAAQNGVMLAQKQHPGKFPRVRFVYEDGLYDGKATISAFNRMRLVEHASIIFVWGHGPVEAVIPLAEAEKVPLIAITGRRDVALNRKFVIRFCTSQDEFVAPLLKDLRGRGFHRFGMIKARLGYIEEVISAFERGLAPNESLEVLGDFESTENDFKTSVIRIKTARLDALAVFLSEEQVRYFVQQASGLGLKLPLFGIHSFGTKSAVSSIQENYPGSVYPASEVEESFASAYHDAYGNDVHLSWAANAFDFALLIADLFGAGEKKPGAEEIVAAMVNVSPRSGASGTLRYVANSQSGSGFTFPVVLKRIEKDGIVTIAGAAQ